MFIVERQRLTRTAAQGARAAGAAVGRLQPPLAGLIVESGPPVSHEIPHADYVNGRFG
ncbi:MAG: hypothetical protein WCC65_16610 [Pseudonocardiaceae bacterium]